MFAFICIFYIKHFIYSKSPVYDLISKNICNVFTIYWIISGNFVCLCAIQEDICNAIANDSTLPAALYTTQKNICNVTAHDWAIFGNFIYYAKEYS
jgi:hypothetical protein